MALTSCAWSAARFLPPKLEKTSPGVASRCTAFVRGAAGAASPDFGAAEAVLVFVVAHVPGQVAVARRVEGSERDGESPLGTPSSRLSLRPGSGPASP